MTFDVGGTLIEPWPSVGHVYAEVAVRNGISQANPDELTRRFIEEWKSKRGFDYSRSAWGELVAKTFASPDHSPAPVPFFDELYECFGRAAAWRIFDDVVPALSSLSGRGIRLGVISNWDERLRPLLHDLRIDQWFEVVVVSHDLNATKPAAAIFREAAAQFGLATSHVLHVGDSRAEDCAGAEGAGMRAALLNRNHPRGRADEIESLLELREYPGLAGRNGGGR